MSKTGPLSPQNSPLVGETEIHTSNFNTISPPECYVKDPGNSTIKLSGASENWSGNLATGKEDREEHGGEEPPKRADPSAHLASHPPRGGGRYPTGGSGNLRPGVCPTGEGIL